MLLPEFDVGGLENLTIFTFSIRLEKILNYGLYFVDKGDKIHTSRPT
jgi:hypothetical protein